MSKVPFYSQPSGLNKGKDEYEVVYIQGKRTQVKKGAYVQVDPIVRSVVEEAESERFKANFQEKELIIEV